MRPHRSVLLLLLAMLVLAGCAIPDTPTGTSGVGPVAATLPASRRVPATAKPPRQAVSRVNGGTTAGASPVSGPPLLNGDTGGPAGSLRTTGTKAVALTFDDGPSPVDTPRLLALLRRYHVKATFCVIGVRVRAYPSLIRQIVADGHTLCDHSWSHKLNLGEESPAAIRADMLATINAIHAAAPGAPVRYFRAPGGNFTPTMVKIAKSLGMASLYWQVDPWDWNAARYGTGVGMTDHIIGNIETYVRPGSIVLSHDISRPNTYTAYQTLLPWLLRRFTLIALPT